MQYKNFKSAKCFYQISDLKQRGILGFGRSRSWEWDLAACLCVGELNLYSMCFFFLIIIPLVGGGAKTAVHGLGVNPTFGVFCPKVDGSSSTGASILLEQGMQMQKNSGAGIYHQKKKMLA